MTIGDLKGIKKDFLICVQNMRYEQYEYDYKQCTQRTSKQSNSVSCCFCLQIVSSDSAII